MPRWRQTVNPETGKSEFIPLDEAAARQDAEKGGIIVKGNFDAFVSPLDGSVISNHRQYDDHCRKHGVVPAQEFSKEFYDRKAAERAKFYDKQRLSKDEKLARKQEIYEIITRAERNG